jgi:hypothetical protein
MKIKLLAILATLYIATAISCKSKNDIESPTKVVEAMAKEAEKLDIKLITPYLCADDKAAIEKANTIASVAGGLGGNTTATILKQIMAKSELLNFKEAKFVNEKINGDNASVQINSKVAKERTIKFKKEDNQWKVYLGVKDLINKELAKLNIGTKIIPGIKKIGEAIKNGKNALENKAN